MNKIIAALVSLLVVGAALFAIAMPESAQAQAGTFTCEAQSPYAFGYATSINQTTACNRALYECAIRTPQGATCYVTRWWYN